MLRKRTWPLPWPHDHLVILHRVLNRPLFYARPWYAAYFLLGIVTSGLVPVLLPLMIEGVSGHLSTVAYVMGSYDIGLLSAPLWGLAAEKQHLYRSLFIGGFFLSAIAVATFPETHTLVEWLVAALLLGAGTSGSATIASLFIVNFAPREEWEPRIGMLQTFNGSGQVVGLLLASMFSHGIYNVGLWLAAAILVPALPLGLLGLPVTSSIAVKGHVPQHPYRRLDIRALSVFPRVNLPSGFGYHLHGSVLQGIRRLPDTFGTPFARFLLSWFFLGLGVTGFFTYFPLFLAHSYGLAGYLSSLIYALSAALGIGLFIFASKWSANYGASIVYQIGLWLRFGGFIILLITLFLPLGWKSTISSIGFAIIVLSWPILSVSGTGLAAYLTPFSEGAAMGLFNASLALATVIGAFLSGPLIAIFGYKVIVVMALFLIIVAIPLGYDLTEGHSKACATPHS